MDYGLLQVTYYHLRWKVESSWRNLRKFKELVILTRLLPMGCDLKSQIRHGPHRKCENVSWNQCLFLVSFSGICHQKFRIHRLHPDVVNPDWGPANLTCGDIFESCFKAQISKLERLFSLKRGKRDVRALSFELWNSIRKCHPNG